MIEKYYDSYKYSIYFSLFHLFSFCKKGAKYVLRKRNIESRQLTTTIYIKVQQNIIEDSEFYQMQQITTKR